jgi:signal transduction histidine kinase
MKSIQKHWLHIIITSCLLLSDSPKAFSQNRRIDSLRQKIAAAKEDTTKVKLLGILAYAYFSQLDSCIFYLGQSIVLAEKINDLPGLHFEYLQLAFALNTASNYISCLKIAQKSLVIAEQLKRNRLISMAKSYESMAWANWRMNFDSLALEYSQRAIQLFRDAGASKAQMRFGPFMTVALYYLKRNKLDSALGYAKKAYSIGLNDITGPSAVATTVANVYAAMHKYDSAKAYHWAALDALRKFNSPLLRARVSNNIARFYLNQDNLDSSIYYASQSYDLNARYHHHFGEHEIDAANILAETYELEKKPDSSLKYLKASNVIRDTLFNQIRNQQFQLLNFDETQRQKDIEIAKERVRNQVRIYSLIAASVVFLLIVIILYRNNRNKQKTNRKLEEQKEQIDLQRGKAETALHELKATQAQLIQSEKMASLGELTAGIAHEIQNPLNFVNNFSEVNDELLAEMEDELKCGHTAEAIALATDVRQNMKRINQHGKRAEGIVTGMLQHSRPSAGERQLTDINALAEEYLRLGLHGMKAKDSSFECKIEENLDQTIGKINVIPQDLGRVFLNIYNNAFYSLNEKKKKQGNEFQPLLSLSSKKLDQKVEIIVHDNGMGISQKNIDKIFQPFFTTKPTGKGTGLGLSLAYDIVTKEHGGSIFINSLEGEFANFVINIPYQ